MSPQEYSANTEARTIIQLSSDQAIKLLIYQTIIWRSYALQNTLKMQQLYVTTYIPITRANYSYKLLAPIRTTNNILPDIYV